MNNIWTLASQIPLFKNKMLYEPFRVKYYGYTFKSYDGALFQEDLCKALHKFYPYFEIKRKVCAPNLLDKSSFYEQNLAKNNIFYEHYYLFKDDTIIDPSYRSFLISSSTSNDEIDYLSKFYKHIYEELPPIFVGNPEEYQKILNTIIYLKQNKYL